MNDIAANIRTLRQEKGLSQDELAQRLHVTRQTVSAWERGVSRPSLDTLGEIARALETEEERLLYGGQTGKRPPYRVVSLWPVLGVAPAYLFGVFYFLWPLLGAVLGSSDFVFLAAGQMFLAMLIVFCFCLLKDEIRNQKFYEQYEPEETLSEQIKKNGEPGEK